MRGLSVLVILLLCAAPRLCAALEISFTSSAAVDGATITLADIAEIKGDSELARALASQFIAHAPAPGESVTTNNTNVTRNLTSQLNLPAAISWQGKATTTITRKAHKIGSRQILKYIDEFIASHKHQLPDAQITFKPTSLPIPFVLPTGKLTYEIIPSNPAILGSSRFSIIFKVDDRVRKNISVRGKLSAMGNVVVATSRIKGGTLIHPGQVALRQVDLARYRTPALMLRDVIGKKSKRNFKKDAVIEHSGIETPPVIVKGQLVKIFLNHGGLKLTATGIARMDGKQNQMIRVKNISSNKILYCQVTAPGLVEVKI